MVAWKVEYMGLYPIGVPLLHKPCPYPDLPPTIPDIYQLRAGNPIPYTKSDPWFIIVHSDWHWLSMALGRGLSCHLSHVHLEMSEIEPSWPLSHPLPKLCALCLFWWQMLAICFNNISPRGGVSNIRPGGQNQGCQQATGASEGTEDCLVRGVDGAILIVAAALQSNLICSGQAVSSLCCTDGSPMWVSLYMLPFQSMGVQRLAAYKWLSFI